MISAFFRANYLISSLRSFSIYSIRCAGRRYQRRLMKSSDSNKIFIWKDATGENIEIHFGIADSAGCMKQISMCRARLGSFDATKTRMEMKLMNLNEPKAKKRKKNENATTVNVSDHYRITPCGCPITDEKTTNDDVFYGCDFIQIGSMTYTLVRDIPVLDKVLLALRPTVGCPIIPSCDWKSDISAENVAFHWYVSAESIDLNVIRDEQGLLQVPGWEHVFTGEIFYPSREHANKFLTVVVDYGEDSLLKTARTSCPIELVNEQFIFEERQQKFCAFALPEANRIRMVCYNILADLYLDLKLEQSKLFFPYCPSQYQEASYRYPVLLRELTGYNADIFCLQEVDFRLQKRFLVKFLAELGFSSEFRCSSGEVNEGQLIAFRRSKFRLIESLPPLGDSPCKPGKGSNPFQGVRISDLVNSSFYPENQDIADFLAKESEMREYLFKKATALQVVHLESVNDSLIRLLVLNTHLTFDPAYEHIKLLQAILCLRFLARVRRRVEADTPSAKIFSLFCGDLNSTPDSGVVRLCRDGCIDETASSWGSNAHAGIPIKESAQYTSLAGFPEYTNYTKFNNDKGFSGCLDYIWCHPPLPVEQVVPMPEHCLVAKYTALPSKIAPSDHLPLICELKL